MTTETETQFLHVLENISAGISYIAEILRIYLQKEAGYESYIPTSILKHYTPSEASLQYIEHVYNRGLWTGDQSIFEEHYVESQCWYCMAEYPMNTLYSVCDTISAHTYIIYNSQEKDWYIIPEEYISRVYEETPVYLLIQYNKDKYNTYLQTIQKKNTTSEDHTHNIQEIKAKDSGVIAKSAIVSVPYMQR